MTITTAIQLSIDALIKPFEGYHKRLEDGGCVAYPDPATKAAPWTIGYGSTGHGVSQGTVWTQEQAEAELKREVGQKAMGLLKLSPSLARASDKRIAALVSFAYNCGLGNYRISTLKKCVDSGDWPGAAKQIVKWNKAAGRIMVGLARRRNAEAAFLVQM